MPNSRATSSITALLGAAFIINSYIVVADLSADTFVYSDQSTGWNLGRASLPVVYFRLGGERSHSQPIQSISGQGRQGLHRNGFPCERRNPCFGIKAIADFGKLSLFCQGEQSPADLVIAA